MLHQRVAEIFLEDEGARAPFSGSLARFRVPDTGIDREELNVVLLVASPHTDEVCCGYPLAGSHSGTNVRNALNRCHAGGPLPDGPIGELVHNNVPNFLRLGIMNVSELPFEREAYGPDCIPYATEDCRCHPEWPNYERHMNTIFAGPQRDRRNHPNCQRLDNEIAANLRLRLDCLHIIRPDVQLVCCGHIAQEFYRKAINRPPPFNLPHPANRGQGGERWQDLDCQNACLQSILGRLWPPQDGA